MQAFCNFNLPVVIEAKGRCRITYKQAHKKGYVMKKFPKVLRNIVSIILAFATVFGFSVTPVFAAERTDSNQFTAALLQQSEETTTPVDGDPVLPSSAKLIGSTVKYVYGISGTLTVSVPSSCFNAKIVVGTYDSDADGFIECYMTRPSGGTTRIGSCEAKNAHFTYTLFYCSKGTYKFLIESTTDAEKLCYVFIYND